MSNKMLEILRGLKSSPDSGNGTTKYKKKFISMKSNHTYSIRFFPYINNVDEVQNNKKFNTHAKNGKNYICTKFEGCTLCDEEIKSRYVEFANIQLISTDDKDYEEKEYYILNVPYDIRQKIKEYEAENDNSICNIYEGSELIIKVEEGDLYKGKRYPAFTNSHFSNNITPINDKLPELSFDEVVAFIKSSAYNLDEIVKQYYPSYTETNLSESTEEKSLEKEVVKDTKNDKENEEPPFDDAVKVKETPEKVSEPKEPVVVSDVKKSEVKTSLETPKQAEKEEAETISVNSFINQFLNDDEDDD